MSHFDCVKTLPPNESYTEWNLSDPMRIRVFSNAPQLKIKSSQPLVNLFPSICCYDNGSTAMCLTILIKEIVFSLGTFTTRSSWGASARKYKNGRQLDHTRPWLTIISPQNRRSPHAFHSDFVPLNGPFGIVFWKSPRTQLRSFPEAI